MNGFSTFHATQPEASHALALSAPVASARPATRFPREALAVTTIEQAAVRKVSRRLIPFLIFCYFVAYLDRVNVSFAALTMNRALGFTPVIYAWGTGIFFIGYLLFEVPSNVILERIGARIWIARIIRAKPTSGPQASYSDGYVFGRRVCKAHLSTSSEILLPVARDRLGGFDYLERKAGRTPKEDHRRCSRLETRSSSPGLSRLPRGGAGGIQAARELLRSCALAVPFEGSRQVLTGQ